MANKTRRAEEIDLIRGACLLVMVLHHLFFDIREYYAPDLFGIFFGDVIEVVVRPFFLMMFLGVSGISTRFSRNNFKRGLRMAGYALILTVISIVASWLFQADYYILFQVIHVIAVSVLVYALLERVYQRRGMLTDDIVDMVGETRETATARTEALRDRFVTALILIGILIIFFWPRINAIIPGAADKSPWLFPIGLGMNRTPGMLDYMPLLPWSGFFFIGAAVGHTLYRDGTSLLKQPLPRWTNFITWSGRHALIIYALHQPVLFLILEAINLFVK